MKRVELQKDSVGLRFTTSPVQIPVVITLLLILISGSVSSSYARISNNLTGRINIGYVQSESDLQKRENVDQEYILGWQKQFNRSFLGRTTVRYYNVGVTQSDGPNNWRSELQPLVEAYWRERNYTMSGLGYYRETRSNDRSAELVTELANLAFKSQFPGLPYLRLGYELQNRYNRLNRNDRDTRDQTVDLDLGYNTKQFSSRYSFRRLVTDDLSRDLAHTSTAHRLFLQQNLRWLGGNAQTSFGYRGDYRVQTDEVRSGGAVPRLLPIFAALAARDESPDLGGLDTVVTLSDGNISNQTVPPINIGGGNTNWNIGADLGFGRELDLIYLYTDSPSDDAVSWRVYTSEDAIIWEDLGTTASNFSPGFSRYEISFENIETRYIKVVNSGFNLSDSVYVTELQALIRLDGVKEVSLDNSVHEVAINNSIKHSSQLTSTENITLRHEPGNELDAGRSEAYFNGSLRQKTSKKFHHTLRGELALLDVETSTVEVDRSLSGGYTAEYQPIQTIDIVASAYARFNYIENTSTEEIYNAVLRTSTDLLPSLQISQEGSVGRAVLKQSQQQVDSWSYRAEASGSVTTWLEGRAGYGYSETIDRSDDVRTRKEYTLGFLYTITPKMSLRGNINGVLDEQVESLYQDFIFSWRLTPKVLTSATIYLQKFDEGARSERYGAQVEYRFTNRTVLTGSVMENDLSGIDGESTLTFRVGVRTGF